MLQLEIAIASGRSFLDLASYARPGPSRRAYFAQDPLEQIGRTVGKVPEVMVKVCGGGKSIKAVAAHFAYIGRQDFQIETDDGEQVKGKEADTQLLKDWELDLYAVENRLSYRSVRGRRPVKLVHNIVLSMPAGSSATGVLQASRDFAREQFALKHRYALVHTDQPHPHVHLVVKAMGEQGERLHISNTNLREWRREFARHLRSQGIAANATDRVVRGANKPHKPDRIYRAMRAGRSTHLQQLVQVVALGLRHASLQPESRKSRLLETRREIVRQWQELGVQLQASGHADLARSVNGFVTRMPAPQTEREQPPG